MNTETAQLSLWFPAATFAAITTVMFFTTLWRFCWARHSYNNTYCDYGAGILQQAAACMSATPVFAAAGWYLWYLDGLPILKIIAGVCFLAAFILGAAGLMMMILDLPSIYDAGPMKWAARSLVWMVLLAVVTFIVSQFFHTMPELAKVLLIIEGSTLLVLLQCNYAYGTYYAIREGLAIRKHGPND